MGVIHRYALFGRFKALCGLSSTPDGIDKETFRKGVPMLSVEDDLFVDRVFEVLDDDGSAIPSAPKTDKPPQSNSKEIIAKS